MYIYPAIDLYKGKVVRLTRGDISNMKIYGDPIKIAGKFSKYFTRLHIVDLEGAFEGKPRNLNIVKEIIKKFDFEIEMGGGFRTETSIKNAFEIGIKHVIIGTKALDFDFLKSMSKKYNGITVSLDIKNGKIGTSGWVNEEGNLKDFFENARKYVKRFIYTDINKDGTLMGSSQIKKFWDKEIFIYAGGIASILDIKSLNKIGFSGAIVGKAIYEKKISLEELKEVEICLQKE